MEGPPDFQLLAAAAGDSAGCPEAGWSERIDRRLLPRSRHPRSLETVAAGLGASDRSLPRRRDAGAAEANAYLRNPTSGLRGRRFQIYVDLLGAPNQIQTRSYKDDYFVVVTPSPEPQIDQVRHAYLHYLLDPLSLRYFEQWSRDKGLADFAQAAPALDDAYKNDFMLLATECVIKAVESRLAHGAQKQAGAGESGVERGLRADAGVGRWFGGLRETAGIPAVLFSGSAGTNRPGSRRPALAKSAVRERSHGAQSQARSAAARRPC